MNPGVAYLDWKRSAGWLESREGLLFAKSSDGLDQLKIFKNPGERFYSCLQETNTLGQTTWPNVLHSYFTQSDYCTNLDKKSPNCWRLKRQLDWRNNSIWTLFLLRKTAAQTSLNATLTSDRTTHTPLQPIYPTWGPPRNHSTHTLTIQHSSCTQTHVHLFTNAKDQDKPEDRPEAVYKIKCSNYQVT